MFELFSAQTPLRFNQVNMFVGYDMSMACFGGGMEEMSWVTWVGVIIQVKDASERMCFIWWEQVWAVGEVKQSYRMLKHKITCWGEQPEQTSGQSFLHEGQCGFGKLKSAMGREFVSVQLWSFMRRRVWVFETVCVYVLESLLMCNVSY